MIRFCPKKLLNEHQLQMANETEAVVLDCNVWEKGRRFFRNVKEEYVVLPISDMTGEIICFAYQDSEANRELRMIRELQERANCLTFSDVFPGYKAVTILECNELAFFCAEYLRKQGVKVNVIGNYWDFLGYHSSYETENGSNYFIYAEGVRSKSEWYHNFLTSVSVEFECIDRIYEENLFYLKIQDTCGTYRELVSRLRHEDHVMIIGDGIVSQDTCDLLTGEGVDICGFVLEQEKVRKRLLGKPVFRLDETFGDFGVPILVYCEEKNSALGSTVIDRYDYYGYRRNENFIVIRDYTDIPDSNLVNVLNGQKAALAGDATLCRILVEYLTRKSSVVVREIGIEHGEEAELDEIMLWVYPRIVHESGSEKGKFLRLASGEHRGDYTDYFSRCEAFITIGKAMGTLYKYVHSCLRPRGILLGKSRGLSGNIFIRGILDGHPNVMVMHKDFCLNIFWYCIRLAVVESENIVSKFWELYKKENDEDEIEKNFPRINKFNKVIEQVLENGCIYSSQELFVLFHLAYSAMWDDNEMTTASEQFIYWEPHIFSETTEERQTVMYFAKWLESREIQGYSITICRNAITRGGSQIDRFGICKRNEKSMSRFWNQVLFTVEEQTHMEYDYWNEFFVRFEDIKQNPRAELEQLCKKTGLPWSETMLCTTCHGKTDHFFGVTGFDMVPVYNIRDDYQSSFDRMKIAVGSAGIQRRYGYPSVNILDFSRRELQEIYLKFFRFQKGIHFEDSEDYINYVLQIQKPMGGYLWKARKEVLLSCIRHCNNWVNIDKEAFFNGLAYIKTVYHFEEESGAGNSAFRWIYTYETVLGSLVEILHFIRSRDKLIFYGIGRETERILKVIEAKDADKIIFADKKAVQGSVIYHGKRVIGIQEIAEQYEDYSIFVTSKLYAREIREEFLAVGVNENRVLYNSIVFSTDIYLPDIEGMN